MKKVFFALSGLLVLTAFLPTVVLAQGDTPRNPVSTPREPSEQVPSDEISSETEDPAAKEVRRQARLDKYKEKTSERITATETIKIKTVCKAAQVKTGSLVTKVSQVQKIREDAYGKVQEKLQKLVDKVEVAGADATTIKTALSGFDEQVDAFKLATAEYEQTLSDLSTLDCEPDPEVFKAALLSAREQRVALVNSSQSLRLYVNEIIKPALLALRTELTGETQFDSTKPEPSSTIDEGVE